MADWYTTVSEEALERLLGEWPDAPEEYEETLDFLLDTARTQVIAYAQGTPEDEILDDYQLLDEDGEVVTDIPKRLVYAQLAQTQALWRLGQTPATGDAGVDGGFTYTPMRLSKTIQQIIRPKAVPSVA